MLINVPQYINVEDKIAGPLTVKQLLWMMAMGAVLFILWTLVPKTVFFIIGIPVALVFLAFAFYKPFGQPLIGFVFAGIRYMFGPKVYVWKRSPQKMQTDFRPEQQQAAVEKDMETQEERRKKALQNLSGIAKIIDSNGIDADKDVVDILKKPEIKR